MDSSSADYLIFHAPTHTRLSSAVRKGMKMKRGVGVGSSSSISSKEGPLHVMVSMEQPKYATVLSDTSYLDNHFDVTLTYSQATHFPHTRVPNLPMSYYPLNIVSPQAVLQPAREFDDKDGFGTGTLSAIVQLFAPLILFF